MEGERSFTFEYFCDLITNHRSTLKHIRLSGGSISDEQLGGHINSMDSYAITLSNLETLNSGDKFSGRVANFFLEARHPRLLRSTLAETRNAISELRRLKVASI